MVRAAADHRHAQQNLNPYLTGHDIHIAADRLGLRGFLEIGTRGRARHYNVTTIGREADRLSRIDPRQLDLLGLPSADTLNEVIEMRIPFASKKDTSPEKIIRQALAALPVIGEQVRSADELAHSGYTGQVAS